jgi:hypothetical protein
MISLLELRGDLLYSGDMTGARKNGRMLSRWGGTLRPEHSMIPSQRRMAVIKAWAI